MRKRDMAGGSNGRGRAANRVEWSAENVRALRAHLRMTQDEVAALLGTRQQTVSEWEVGRHRPRGASVMMLTHLAETSGFDAAYMRLDAVYVSARR